MERRADPALAQAARARAAGGVGEARAGLAAVDLGGASPTLLALYQLGRAEIAMGEIRAWDAARALDTARTAAAAARVAALSAEIDRARAALDGPCARLG